MIKWPEDKMHVDLGGSEFPAHPTCPLHWSVHVSGPLPSHGPTLQKVLPVSLASIAECHSPTSIAISDGQVYKCLQIFRQTLAAPFNVCFKHAQTSTSLNWCILICNISPVTQSFWSSSTLFLSVSFHFAPVMDVVGRSVYSYVSVAVHSVQSSLP
jgi:hypothetical protein